jgi:hypothetical protein
LRHVDSDVVLFQGLDYVQGVAEYPVRIVNRYRISVGQAIPWKYKPPKKGSRFGAPIWKCATERFPEVPVVKFGVADNVDQILDKCCIDWARKSSRVRRDALR